MHLAAGHHPGDGIPDARLNAGRLVRDDQHVLAVVTLEIFCSIGRESESEIVFAT
jgi:hypothetical protein